MPEAVRQFAEERRTEAEARLAEDRRLLEGLRNRSEDAFVELVERYQASMLRVARRLVNGDTWIAEEVTQEAWIAVLRGIDRFEGRSSLRTWLFAIVTNLSLQRRAREQKRELPFSAFAHRESEGDAPAVGSGEFIRLWPRGHWKNAPSDWEVNPEDLLVRAELRKQVEAAIATLPEAQQTVITLRDVLGFTAEEICGSLGITANNMRVLLHRGRAKVRATLDREL